MKKPDVMAKADKVLTQCQEFMVTLGELAHSLDDPAYSASPEARRLRGLLGQHHQTLRGELMPALKSIGASDSAPANLAGPPPKAPNVAGPPPKAPSVAGPPPKAPHVAGPPPKAPRAAINVEQAKSAYGPSNRIIPRYNKKIPLSYRLKGKHGVPSRGYSRDIGAMGLFIMANRMEKAGQHLTIEIRLPNQETVQLEAEVVWTKWVPPALRTVESPGFGVKILSAPEQWFNYFMKITA